MFSQEECFRATFEKEELKGKATVKPSLCEVPPAVGISTKVGKHGTFGSYQWGRDLHTVYLDLYTKIITGLCNSCDRH